MHNVKYSALEGHFQINKASELKSAKLSLRANKQYKSSVCVSYIIAEKIAKCRKPFVDGEFVKECLQYAIDIFCLSQAQYNILGGEK